MVPPGMFAGRLEELGDLEKFLFQTKHGNPIHFLIQGERGIGKSSLMLFLQYVATGQIKSINDFSFNFIMVNVELEPSNDYGDIARKIGAEFQRQIASSQKVKDLIKTGWDFLKRWEVMGLKYNQETRSLEPHQLIEDLTHTIHQTLLEVGEGADGVVIVIDEADKPPVESNLGEFIKTFTERLTKRGCNNVCVGLAGISGIVIDKLKQSHESSPRNIKIMTLEPLAEHERIQVIRMGLAEAEQKNGFKVEITGDAESWIAYYSEGYPHFIQQYSYCAFDADSDNIIDEEDVHKGAFGQNGAFHQLGEKYFSGWYYDEIGSDEYRAVLKAMANHLDQWVSKSDLRNELTIKDHTLNNAVQALVKRNIIVPMPGKKGIYRLPNRSFAVWIKAIMASQESTNSSTSEEGGSA